jgi:hypothetical protein
MHDTREFSSTHWQPESTIARMPPATVREVHAQCARILVEHIEQEVAAAQSVRDSVDAQLYMDRLRKIEEFLRGSSGGKSGKDTEEFLAVHPRLEGARKQIQSRFGYGVKRNGTSRIRQRHSTVTLSPSRES